MKDVHEYTHSEWAALSNGEKEAAWDRHWLPHSTHRAFGSTVCWPITTRVGRHARHTFDPVFSVVLVATVCTISFLMGVVSALLRK